MNKELNLNPYQLACEEELKSYSLRPKRELSQTFLVDPNAITTLTRAVQKIHRPDTKIVEVGGGLGYITEGLAKAFPQLEVLEIDDDMLRILNKKFIQYKNVSIIKKDLNEYISKEPYMMTGSIPFHLTSKFLKRYMWDTKNKPYAMSLIIDHQYAKTLMNQPPRSYRISILAQLYGDMEIMGKITREMTYPQPKIKAAIINMVRRKKYPVPKNFWKVVHHHFNHFPTPEVESPKRMSIEEWIVLCNNTIVL